jgi:hypothetical protein
MPLRADLENFANVPNISHKLHLAGSSFKRKLSEWFKMTLIRVGFTRISQLLTWNSVNGIYLFVMFKVLIWCEWTGVDNNSVDFQEFPTGIKLGYRNSVSTYFYSYCS